MNLQKRYGFLKVPNIFQRPLSRPPNASGCFDVRIYRTIRRVRRSSGQPFKDKLPLFGGLENARFRQQVVPGDTLKLQVKVLRLSARGGKAFGEAFVNGNLACSAELMFIAVESNALGRANYDRTVVTTKSK